ncbi:MAG: hypothetical protein GEU87_16840 [Alphaproteobacteria bacterium]|nr:hypothetical protein [Alphaproteobacteria bacterium]
MKKFFTPMALAIALTASGAAFAGSSGGSALYDSPNPFAAVKSPAAAQHALAGHQDQRLSAESQQASMAYVPGQQGWAHQDWAQPAPAAHDGFHDPE